MKSMFDIDAVVLWVDGNDPMWLAEKEQYAPMGRKDAVNKNRFRDWNLMKYWFRGIEKFAPWLRKIHFVTWGHLPEFLDTRNPKLHIVNHKDFMPEGSLPTYNSMALELNLWRIEGLADRFIYLNDDMFFLKAVSAEEYFDAKTGLPKIEFMELPIRMKDVGLDWEVTLANDIGFVNKHISKKGTSLSKYFGKYLSFKNPFACNVRNFAAKILYPEYYTGMKVHHGISPLLKSTYEEVWNADPEILLKVSKQKFRQYDAINQWALLMWQVAKGNFKPGRSDHITYRADKISMQPISHIITTGKYASICLNDPNYDIDFEYCQKCIEDAFAAVLPVKSSFEV